MKIRETPHFMPVQSLARWEGRRTEFTLAATCRERAGGAPEGSPKLAAGGQVQAAGRERALRDRPELLQACARARLHLRVAFSQEPALRRTHFRSARYTSTCP